MKVSAHYQYWVVPGVVVYDLKGLSVRQTPIDVHTAFLEFAKKLKEKRYSRVDLSYKGTTKFSIDGASFAQLGKEYAKRNFDYVLYNVPAPLPRRRRHAARQTRRHRPRRPARVPPPWYGEDQLTKTVTNGL